MCGILIKTMGKNRKFFWSYGKWSMFRANSMKPFHSIIVAIAILVPTLYGKCGSRLHGFWQYCMAGWKFYFLDSVWLKAGQIVELLITLYIFFWREGPYIYICKERAQMLFKWYSLNCLNFFQWNVAWSLWNNIA